MKISINTHISTNASRTEVVNGRDYIVVNAMLIRGDTAMNGVLYTLDQVSASYHQLNELPAPLGHPKIGDENVSANNNFARGVFDVGAFVRNAKMIGKEVHSEIWIDKEVAGRTERGKNLLAKIASKAMLGVSTGLMIAHNIVKNGVDELGQAFSSIGQGFHFDHVAILDGEEAAGALAGTKLIYNSDNGAQNALFVVNHDEGGQSPPEPTGENPMEIKIDASDLSKADRVKLQSMTANELVAAIDQQPPEITLDDAKAVIEKQGMKVNSSDDVVLSRADHEALKANADKFVEAETKRVNEIKDSIVANSQMKAEDLDGMTEPQLVAMAQAYSQKPQDYSILAGVTTNASNGGQAVEVDYS